jgi:4,5-DOPA dioxygenase extradiol
LRDDGVLVIGSGFTTHGLPFLDDPSPAATPPGWSVDFDSWAADRFSTGAPLFVALGASGDPQQKPGQIIDGYWIGLAKRSIQLV